VLRGYVAARLREDWSPEQITTTLKKPNPAGSRMSVSHETIYKSLFVHLRGVLAKDLLKHLRSGRPTRRPIHNTVTLQWCSQIKDAVSVRERAAEVEDRAVPGHREGELIIGRHWTQMATVVEQSSRFTVLARLDSREMITVFARLSRGKSKLSQHLGKSLT
jgi:IS30 family transposase